MHKETGNLVNFIWCSNIANDHSLVSGQLLIKELTLTSGGTSFFTLELFLKRDGVESELLALELALLISPSTTFRRFSVLSTRSNNVCNSFVFFCISFKTRSLDLRAFRLFLEMSTSGLELSSSLNVSAFGSSLI